MFAIPNPNTRGNPRFRTGERVFRLTSSSTNSTNPEPESFAQATYSATGILTTVQETVIATRNADVVRTSVRDNRTTTNTSTRDAVVGWWDTSGTIHCTEQKVVNILLKSMYSSLVKMKVSLLPVKFVKW